jgi:nucleoside-diphosphate-sugar epimerase
MKFFITGGAGFIGSHLAESLIKERHHVFVLDDLSTGQMSNIEHLIGNRFFAYVVGSVRTRALVEQLVDLCDVTVHLAAAVGVRLIVEQPVRTIETNVHGTEVVLEAAAQKQKPVLIASSSEVYGKSTNVPFKEDDDLVIGPTKHSRWAYACSKALDEWLALAYFQEKGVPVVIARFFNIVGPRQTGRYGMVLPTFAGQAVRDEPIKVFGTGEQSRCFAHVLDIVEAIKRLIATPKAYGQVFNIGSNREVTINKLAEMVRDTAKSRSSIEHIPYEKAYAEGFEDMMRRVPAVDKLEQYIGLKPSISLEHIIEDVVTEQREILNQKSEPRSLFARSLMS